METRNNQLKRSDDERDDVSDDELKRSDEERDDDSEENTDISILDLISDVSLSDDEKKDALAIIGLDLTERYRHQTGETYDSTRFDFYLDYFFDSESPEENEEFGFNVYEVGLKITLYAMTTALLRKGSNDPHIMKMHQDLYDNFCELKIDALIRDQWIENTSDEYDIKVGLMHLKSEDRNKIITEKRRAIFIKIAGAGDEIWAIEISNIELATLFSLVAEEDTYEAIKEVLGHGSCLREIYCKFTGADALRPDERNAATAYIAPYIQNIIYACLAFKANPSDNIDYEAAVGRFLKKCIQKNKDIKSQNPFSAASSFNDGEKRLMKAIVECVDSESLNKDRLSETFDFNQHREEIERIIQQPSFEMRILDDHFDLDRRSSIQLDDLRESLPNYFEKVISYFQKEEPLINATTDIYYPIIRDALGLESAEYLELENCFRLFELYGYEDYEDIIDRIVDDEHLLRELNRVVPGRLNAERKGEVSGSVINYFDAREMKEQIRVYIFDLLKGEFGDENIKNEQERLVRKILIDEANGKELSDGAMEGLKERVIELDERDYFSSRLIVVDETDIYSLLHSLIETVNVSDIEYLNGNRECLITWLERRRPAFQEIDPRLPNHMMCFLDYIEASILSNMDLVVYIELLLGLLESAKTIINKIFDDIPESSIINPDIYLLCFRFIFQKWSTRALTEGIGPIEGQNYHIWIALIPSFFAKADYSGTILHTENSSTFFPPTDGVLQERQPGCSSVEEAYQLIKRNIFALTDPNSTMVSRIKEHVGKTKEGVRERIAEVKGAEESVPPITDNLLDSNYSSYDAETHACLDRLKNGEHQLKVPKNSILFEKYDEHFRAQTVEALEMFYT